MIFITIMITTIYVVLIAWTCQSLRFCDKSKKVAYVIIGFIIVYIITLITFQTTKSEISYQNVRMQKDVQNIIVLLFTGINGIITMPQVGKILDKINDGEKEKRKKTINNISSYIHYLFNIRKWIYEKYTRGNFKCV